MFATATPDRARQEHRIACRRLEQRYPRRGLEGVTVAWKDVFDIATIATRAGTRFFSAAPAIQDHPLVAKLSTMGAICVGKTSLTELAFSVLGENDVLPAPVNPWSNDGRVCGGSSSGSAAAVSRGVVDVAIGTDSGGSVRLPAAWCGVVGFKPTSAHIAKGSVVPFSPSLDAIGQFGSTVADVTALYVALSGRASHVASAGTPVRLFRAQLPGFLQPDPEVAAVYERAWGDLVAAGLAAQQHPCDPVARAHELRDHHGGSISVIEGESLWRDPVLKAGDLASPRLQRWAGAACSHPRGRLRILERVRRDFIEWFDMALPSPATLVLPASPIDPPLRSSLEDDRTYDQVYARSHALLWPFNELDAAAISIPCGRTAHGLPVGLQIVAPRGRDHDVLRAAAAAEAALGLPPASPAARAS